MKVGDKVRINSNYVHCGNECSGSEGTIVKIYDDYICVSFYNGSGYCHACDGRVPGHTCDFNISEFDVIKEHNRNGANV